VVSNREWVDGLEVVVQDPKDLKAEAASAKRRPNRAMNRWRRHGSACWNYCYSRIHQLQYRKRTEIAVEIVGQLEAEGRFPQAHYAFDKGGLTLELTRLIESRGKHWVSEIEVSRHTRGRVTGGAWMKWVRSCANSTPRVSGR